MTRVHENCPCGASFSIETEDDKLALTELTKFRSKHKDHAKPGPWAPRKVYPYISNATNTVKAESKRVSGAFDAFVSALEKDR